MKKPLISVKNISIFFVLLLFIIIESFSIHKNTKPKIENKPLQTFTVALDWTPNTNHTGLYVALFKNWYKAQGLNVTILPYSSSVSPDVLLTTGKADIAINSTEGVINDAATGSPVTSIAAIIEHNTSGFMTLQESGIKSPKDFDGKTYGGGGSPSESAVVRAIIAKNGGKGNFKNITLDVEAMQALSSKKIDFVWVFEGWEVIQAQRQGLKVNYFPSLQYGIPDYYTPVIVATPKEISKKSDILKRFMIATKKGYEYATSYPKESAQILINSNPPGTFPDKELIFDSQKFLSAHYMDKGNSWGLQSKENWHNYPQFLIDNKAVLDGNGKPISSLNLDSLYTNKFLE